MNIILFGPPGSGKGTQSNLLCKNKNLDLIKVSVGDILRNSIKKDSNESKKINSGAFVSNEVVFNLVYNFIKKYKDRNFLFDGFPRTIEQSKFFDIYEIDIKYFIILNLDDNEILNRLSNGRLIHEKSGRVYHEHYNPPKIKNIDDVTKEKLVKRNDDKESTILDRINLYKTETNKLIEFYRYSKKHINILDINANDKIENINL